LKTILSEETAVAAASASGSSQRLKASGKDFYQKINTVITELQPFTLN